MLDNTQSIICAFGLAAAAPRSPYRHLELCGIALSVYRITEAPQISMNLRRIPMVEVTGLEPAASWSQTTRATNCATPRSYSLSIIIHKRCGRQVPARQKSYSQPEQPQHQPLGAHRQIPRRAAQMPFDPLQGDPAYAMQNLRLL